MVATAIRKFSSKTCLFKIPFQAFNKISWPITRYGIINSTNFSQPSIGSRLSTTINTAATIILVNTFFCFLFMPSPLSVKTSNLQTVHDGYSLQICLLLQEDLAVILYLFAVLVYLLHNSLYICTLFKFHGHFQGHEVYRCVLNACRLLCSVFHLVCTVCAVNVDFVSFFHDKILSLPVLQHLWVLLFPIAFSFI